MSKIIYSLILVLIISGYILAEEECMSEEEARQFHKNSDLVLGIIIGSLFGIALVIIIFLASYYFLREKQTKK